MFILCKSSVRFIELKALLASQDVSHDIVTEANQVRHQICLNIPKHHLF